MIQFLINVYLPCSGSDKWEDEYVDCSALIANKLSELEYNNILFGGDLNTDFACVHPLRWENKASSDFILSQ